MILKILGAVLVIVATSLIGMEFAARFERRKRSIADFIAALTMLESEISFTLAPLHQAFASIARQLESRPVGAFFEELSSQLEQNSIQVQKTWTNILKKRESQLYLSKSDLEILAAFATNLGKTDRDNQMKSIRHTLAQLELQREQAEQACIKNKKMYQSFGVLSGILIAILLF